MTRAAKFKAIFELFSGAVSASFLKRFFGISGEEVEVDFFSGWNTDPKDSLKQRVQSTDFLSYARFTFPFLWGARNREILWQTDCYQFSAWWSRNSEGIKNKQGGFKEETFVILGLLIDFDRLWQQWMQSSQKRKFCASFFVNRCRGWHSIGQRQSLNGCEVGICAWNSEWFAPFHPSRCWSISLFRRRLPAFVDPIACSKINEL